MRNALISSDWSGCHSETYWPLYVAEMQLLHYIKRFGCMKIG